MCYSKEQGGLRCISSVKKNIISVKKRIDSLKEDNGSEEKIINAERKLAGAIASYDTTEEGLAHLKRKIAESSENPEEMVKFQERYNKGFLRRQEGLIKYEKWKSKNGEEELEECEPTYVNKKIDLPKKREFIADHDNEQVKKATMILTESGSRLYGLANANSDEDYYRVVKDEDFYAITGSTRKDNKKIVQKIIDGKDNLVVSFDTFVNLCNEGNILAIEALFSKKAEIDHLEAYRNQWVISVWDGKMRESYRQTVHRLAYSKTYKHRRHAARLAVNLEQLYSSNGRFNPTLTQEHIDKINRIAALPPKEYASELSKLTRVEIASEWDYDELEANYKEVEKDIQARRKAKTL